MSRKNGGLSTESEIQVDSHRVTDSLTTLTLTADQGFLTAVYSEGTGKFGITYVRVDPDARKNGLGKELLGKSQEAATELGACVMHATIISREALVAFRQVFGDDSVTVSQEGTFAPDDGVAQINTNAQFWHELNQ